ncbi:hypothetical protein NEIRO03_0840 [Nematocida sp. AWRm78]|nr:hypothetical protein NEIRO02_0746 [Nematocida sp. AWRm79]KAI5183222.1 hypothetical protein NEIRO03_0840 [Nematocida sp. AWRm78]
MYQGMGPAKRNLNELSYIKQSIMRMARMIVNVTNGEEEYPSILNFSTTEPISEKTEEKNKPSKLSNNSLNLFVSVMFYVLTSICTLLIFTSINYVVYYAMDFIINLFSSKSFSNEKVFSIIGIFVSTFVVQIIVMLFSINAWKDSICLICKNSRQKILGVILFIITLFIGQCINTMIWINIIKMAKVLAKSDIIMYMGIPQIFGCAFMIKIVYDIYMNRAGKRQIYEYIIGAHCVVMFAIYIASIIYNFDINKTPVAAFMKKLHA